MIVSNCPRCNEAFRIPSGELPEDAYAKCPWCRDTFPLTDVLDRLPPILEVWSADGQRIVLTQPVAAVGARGGTLRDDVRFMNRSSSAQTLVDREEPQGFDFGTGDETIVDESWGSTSGEEAEAVQFELASPSDAWAGEPQRTTPVAPMKVAPGRKKKGKFAGIKTAVGVILGGALAFPIADGLLVLAGQPGLGLWRSILGGVSESSERNAVAATLPAEEPTDHTTQLGESKGRSLVPNAASQELAAAADAVDAARDEIMRQTSTDQTSASETDATDPDPSAALATEPSPNPAAQTQPTLAEDDAAGGNQEAKASTPTSDLKLPAAITEVLPASAAEELESPGLSTFNTPGSDPTDSAELIALAERAGKMVAAVSAFNGEPQERTRRLDLTYETIAMACELASTESDALGTLAAQIKDSSISQDIEQSASKWLADASRPSAGIALIGRPGAGGDGPIITLDSGQTIAVMGEILLPAAERILVMGTIVDEGSSVKVILAEAMP